MPIRKRRRWLPMSGEPVCRLYALWRRERDVAQFHGTERTGLNGSKATVLAPPGEDSTRKPLQPGGKMTG
jgi:hypothetical protein